MGWTGEKVGGGKKEGVVIRRKLTFERKSGLVGSRNRRIL